MNSRPPVERLVAVSKTAKPEKIMDDEKTAALARITALTLRLEDMIDELDRIYGVFDQAT